MKTIRGFSTGASTKALRAATLVLLAACGPAHQVWAQSDSGQVVGTVKDAAGASIPGATLTLTNQENGLVLTGKSNGSGELLVPAVPRGMYTARIEAAGFQSQTESVTVNVTQSQTVVFQMAPGAVTSTVEVTGAASLVNTSDPTLGETIEGTQITELPLNGRNTLSLALLSPGVTNGAHVENGQDTAGRFSESGGAQISVNGVRAQANNFILDGVDNNDGLQNVVLFFPNVDATQQFKIDTSVAPAQFGRGGGALIITSIKSGTNQLHGSAFYFNRSAAFQTNPNYRFQGAPETPTPPFSQNQFGGSAGLPIVKNKLFLFGDYYGERRNFPSGAHYVTVPTALMRTGDFSELLNPNLTYGSFNTTYPVCVPNYATLNQNFASTSHGQIYDPQTNCQVFPGNKIPASRLNPAAVNYLNAFPLPSRNDRILQNYLSIQNSNFKSNTFDARLDWNPSSNNLFFFRASYDNTASLNGSEFPLLPASGGGTYVHARGYDLGYTHTFSAHAVNEARIAYNRDNYGYNPTLAGTPISANLGIVNANRSPLLTGGALIGGAANQLEYTGDFGTFAVPQNTYEITDTLNLNRGKHSLNLGGTVLRRQVNFFRPIAGKGIFSISGNGAGFTGFEDTELLVGGVNNYQIGAQNGFFGNVSQEDAVFAQDDWRVSNRLTLNLGVRWDLLTYPFEEHDNQAAFDVNTGTVLEAGKNGVSRSIINQDYKDFAPRVGFAYDLRGDGKSSIHGGYGIFYFPDYGGISNQLGQQPPFGGATQYNAYQGYCITFTGQTAAPSTAPGGYKCPGYTSAAAVTTPLPAPGNPDFNPAAPTGFSGLAVNQNNKRSREQEWNLQIQQQFSPKDVVSIAYVGNYGDRLSTYYYYSYRLGSPTQPFANQNGITLNDYNGHANYNALQVHYEHRGKNVLATGSYAFSHAFEDSASAYSGTPTATLLYFDQGLNYGNSIQDQRHVFSSSIVWFLPFGHGQQFGTNAGRLTDLLIGGWQLNNIAQVQSGQPVDLIAAGNNLPYSIRPDLVAPIRYPKSISGRWFDPASFRSDLIPTVAATDRPGVTVPVREGTLARNQVYGPGFRVDNLSVQKDLHISEGKVMEFHVDAFNVFNTPNFQNPNNAQGNAGTFGQITSLNGNLRLIQLAARLAF